MPIFIQSIQAIQIIKAFDNKSNLFTSSCLDVSSWAFPASRRMVLDEVRPNVDYSQYWGLHPWSFDGNGGFVHINLKNCHPFFCFFLDVCKIDIKKPFNWRNKPPGERFRFRKKQQTEVEEASSMLPFFNFSLIRCSILFLMIPNSTDYHFWVETTSKACLWLRTCGFLLLVQRSEFG